MEAKNNLEQTERLKLFKGLFEDFKLFYMFEQKNKGTEFECSAMLLNNSASLISIVDKALDKFENKDKKTVLDFLVPSIANYDKENNKGSVLLNSLLRYFDLQNKIIHKNYSGGDKVINFEQKLNIITDDLVNLKSNIKTKISAYKNSIEELKERGLKDGADSLMVRMNEMVSNLGNSLIKIENSSHDFAQIRDDLDSYQSNIADLEKLNYKISLQIFPPNSKTLTEQNELLIRIESFEQTLKDKSFRMMSLINQFFDKKLIEESNLLLQKSSNGKDVLNKTTEIEIKSGEIRKVGLENELKNEIVNLIQTTFNHLNASQALKIENAKTVSAVNQEIYKQTQAVTKKSDLDI